MASYTRDINMVQAGTWFFVVYAVVITLTRPSLGLIFDRKGENYVLYPCFISLAIGILLLAFADASWMIYYPPFCGSRIWHVHVQRTGRGGKNGAVPSHRDCYIHLLYCP